LHSALIGYLLKVTQIWNDLISILFQDHPPQEFSYITKFTDLMSARNIIKLLSETITEGGGDNPEAVMDGLRDGLTNTSWRLGEDGETKSKR